LAKTDEEKRRGVPAWSATNLTLGVNDFAIRKNNRLARQVAGLKFDHDGEKHEAEREA
jgi:hypothetical protein